MSTSVSICKIKKLCEGSPISRTRLIMTCKVTWEALVRPTATFIAGSNTRKELCKVKLLRWELDQSTPQKLLRRAACKLAEELTDRIQS